MLGFPDTGWPFVRSLYFLFLFCIILPFDRIQVLSGAVATGTQTNHLSIPQSGGSNRLQGTLCEFSGVNVEASNFFYFIAEVLFNAIMKLRCWLPNGILKKINKSVFITY